MKCITLLLIFDRKFAKKHVAKEKAKKTPNTQRQKGFDEKSIKIIKENTEVKKSSNQRKYTKQDQRKWKQLKNFNKYKRNLRETRVIAAIKKNPKYFYKFVKNNWTIRAGIRPLQDEEGNLKPSNKKMSELLNEQYNSIFSTLNPTKTIKYPKDFFGHTQANTLSEINIIIIIIIIIK